MSISTFILVRVLLDCIGVIFIIFLGYVIVYIVKKYMLEKWVSKAVNAAEEVYKAPTHSKEYAAVKKDWVLKFLKDNGLTAGVSDVVVDVLIEAEVYEITLKQENSVVQVNSNTLKA